MTTKMVFVHALTPLHAGIGAGTDVIDLPIAREVSTNVPYLPGSSIKGTLRSHVAKTNPRIAEKMFGPDTKNAADFAGAMQFSDAYVVAMPIRSLAGMFAWVTSPYLLLRLMRDTQQSGVNCPGVVSDVPTAGVVLTSTSKLRVGSTSNTVFEDIALQVVANTNADAWADVIAAGTNIAPAFVKERFCIVSDDVLSFLLRTATEVRARVRLNDDKTVQTGALWYEESLPTETILAGIVNVMPNSKTEATIDQMFAALAPLTGSMVQFGGKTTTGHGFCNMKIS
jgi:CRISPR-associated protein Cmr4